MAADETSDYRFGYARDELERLRHQHEVWSRQNRRLLERAGFRAGMTVVDLGCGPGHTTLEIARLVGPRGRVLAVDRDGQRSLRLLEELLAEESLTNVETREADLQQFDLKPGSVDAVYGRWVLMYLPLAEVQALVGRIAHWLRSGGTFVSAEFCNFRHMHLHPPSALLPVVVEALYQSVAGDRGRCPEIGNLVPGLLRREGLEVEVSVATMAAQAGTPGWRWPDSLFQGHLSSLVDEGRLSSEQQRAFMEEWRRRSADPDSIFFGSPVMEALGTKGAGTKILP